MRGDGGRIERVVEGREEKGRRRKNAVGKELREEGSTGREKGGENG